MADCGICLDVLRSPVVIPCGHIHCEKCLRNHINSGTDALRSACPTCRKPFHIATPDFTFVPQKYHDFIMPSVRKIYMDVPSVAALKKEIELLTQHLGSLSKDNERLRKRYADCKHAVEDMESERQAIVEQEENARQEADELRSKCSRLRKQLRQVQSRYSQYLETSREILPKEEEPSVSLRDSNPPRPKRALPESRSSHSMYLRDETESQLTKRQRTHRDSDIGSSSGQTEVRIEYEDDEYDE